MERNDTSVDGAATSSQSDANEFSGSGSTPQDANFDFAGATPATDQPAGIRDRARNVIGSAGDKLADVGSTVRDRANTAKDKLADALESGAGRLRDRAQTDGPTLAGATADGSTAIPTDGKIAQVSDKVAGGMEVTAEWLREADLDSLKAGLENQVKEHPGRTLLIAAGLRYLIGRAFRSNQ